MTKNCRVFEIERFAIHDGPGIRTTIFMQGCPLRCPWCANPESQDLETHLFHLDTKCVQCRKCEEVCLVNAITFRNNEFILDKSKCNLCRKCEENCSYNAIRFVGEDLDIDSIMETISLDEDYYKESNGGITISGGEAFFQYDSFLELCKRIKEKNYHLCVETTGQTSENNLREINNYVDLFLFDIKHIDKEKLELVTKGNYDMIMNSLCIIAKNNPDKIIIRVPIIPDFNMEDDTIEKICKLAQLLKIKNIHLLPFHNYGKTKYKQMGLLYPYARIKSLNSNELIRFKEIGEMFDCDIQIGG